MTLGGALVLLWLGAPGCNAARLGLPREPGGSGADVDESSGEGPNPQESHEGSGDPADEGPGDEEAPEEPPDGPPDPEPPAEPPASACPGICASLTRLCGGPTSTWAVARGRPRLPTGRLVVRVTEAAAARPGGVAGWARERGLTVVRRVEGLDGAWVLAVADGDAAGAARALVDDGLAAWAHPDLVRERTAHHRPDDPLFPAQWVHAAPAQGWPDGLPPSPPGLDLRTPAAWDLEQGRAETAIAVFDDGVDWEHPDLRPALRDGMPGDPLVVNPPRSLRRALNEGLCAHGTAVAGVAAAVGDNGRGVAGVCPGCSVLPVFTGPGWDASSVMAEAWLAAARAGAAVINNSWGPPDGRPEVDDGDASRPAVPLDDVEREALDAVAREGRGGLGTVVVFSAGNGNEPTVDNPYLTHPAVIGVGAVDASGRKSPYADHGDGVWVVAPSDGALDDGAPTPGVWTTDARGRSWGYNADGGPESAGDASGDYVSTFGGTSAAAPAVAGVAALVISANPALTAAQVKDILRRTARPVDPEGGGWAPDPADPDPAAPWRSPWYGYGLVDAEAAVRLALSGCADPASRTACAPRSFDDEPPRDPVPAMDPVPGGDPFARVSEGRRPCDADRRCPRAGEACLQRVDRYGRPVADAWTCVPAAPDSCLPFCQQMERRDPARAGTVAACLGEGVTDCGQAEGCLN